VAVQFLLHRVEDAVDFSTCTTLPCAWSTSTTGSCGFPLNSLGKSTYMPMVESCSQIACRGPESESDPAEPTLSMRNIAIVRSLCFVVQLQPRFPARLHGGELPVALVVSKHG